MKYQKVLALLMILVSPSIWAFDSSEAYNTITFSYTDQANVSQVIVLDENQRSTATSITLTVDAKDGGGRPTHNLDGTCAAYCTQYDVSRIRIHAFNSSGTSIGNMTTETPLKNWGSASNPGWSTGPGDNLFDWTTVSVTLSASDITGGFAAVAYVRVYLISDEGSYWAGNYGVQYRTPTLQLNGSGSNLLYNSEFGVDSTGVRAQGWIPSYGTYGTCGATSGNSICVTQEPTVTANMWGGGEDPNGGTTSGTSGGYSSVLTTDTADAAASGENISSPSGGSGTPTFTQLKFSRYQVADSQWNVSACTQTTTCQIYSKNPGTMYKIPWTSGQWQWQAGQYVQFEASGNADYPWTAKVYNSDGTLAGVVGTGKIISMGPDYFFFVGDDNNTGQLFSLTSGMSDTNGVTWTGTLNPTTEQVDAYAAGGSISPLASGETVGAPALCCGGSTAQFFANGGFAGRVNDWTNNNLTGDNAVYVTQVGNNNTATIQQSGGRNYVNLSVAGHNNVSTVTQTTTNSSTQSNFIEATVLGGYNTINLEQTSTGQIKGIYATVHDDYNTATVQQKDNGGHYSEINISGSNKTVNILQQGSASHMAKIEIFGGATSIDVSQSGSTQLYYSINFQCAQISCAAITVTQGQ